MSFSLKEWASNLFVSSRLILVALIFVVFFARLLFLPFLFPFPNNPELTLIQDHWGSIAWNLINGRGYVLKHTNLEGVISYEPDVSRGPVTVLWLASIFSLFGRRVWAVLVSNWLLDCGSAIILWYLAQSIYPKRKWVAILTVVMFAFYVPHIWFTYQAMSESVFTFLWMLFLYVFISLLNAYSLRRAILTGLCLGLAALARPVVLPFPLVIFGLMLFRYRHIWKTIRCMVVLCGVFLMVLSPWIVRNYLVFQTFIPGTSLLGLNLISNSHYDFSP